uniref:Uncharacterized protein n=2 Tax=Craspedostauros australis TaxID=1486917 RepID=A0A7R9WMZ6_9STRA|mmetsp:Transcript_10585/g.29170  ORF Transcript_10585/g.29170 Transcript_10585/m.29170 type:complete len:743 (+) Transcript_10585:235-2463(+)
MDTGVSIPQIHSASSTIMSECDSLPNLARVLAIKDFFQTRQRERESSKCCCAHKTDTAYVYRFTCIDGSTPTAMRVRVESGIKSSIKSSIKRPESERGSRKISTHQRKGKGKGNTQATSNFVSASVTSSISIMQDTARNCDRTNPASQSNAPDGTEQKQNTDICNQSNNPSLDPAPENEILSHICTILSDTDSATDQHFRLLENHESCLARSPWPRNQGAGSMPDSYLCIPGDTLGDLIPPSCQNQTNAYPIRWAQISAYVRARGVMGMGPIILSTSHLSIPECRYIVTVAGINLFTFINPERTEVPSRRCNANRISALTPATHSPAPPTAPSPEARQLLHALDVLLRLFHECAFDPIKNNISIWFEPHFPQLLLRLNVRLDDVRLWTHMEMTEEHCKLIATTAKSIRCAYVSFGDGGGSFFRHMVESNARIESIAFSRTNIDIDLLCEAIPRLSTLKSVGLRCSRQGDGPGDHSVRSAQLDKFVLAIVDHSGIQKVTQSGSAPATQWLHRLSQLIRCDHISSISDDFTVSADRTDTGCLDRTARLSITAAILDAVRDNPNLVALDLDLSSRRAVDADRWECGVKSFLRERIVGKKAIGVVENMLRQDRMSSGTLTQMLSMQKVSNHLDTVFSIVSMLSDYIGSHAPCVVGDMPNSDTRKLDDDCAMSDTDADACGLVDGGGASNSSNLPKPAAAATSESSVSTSMTAEGEDGITQKRFRCLDLSDNDANGKEKVRKVKLRT